MPGVSTFCLHTLPLGQALERISAITDTIELMDDGPHFTDSPEILESYDVRYTIHAPTRSVNIASTLEPIRRASVEVTVDCFSVAAEVGADVVLHPGYFAWPGERDAAVRQLTRSLHDLGEAAEERSIRFSVENMGDWDYFFLRSPEDIALIGDARFALDVGHAHQMKCLDRFLSCRISHVHLHDNDGTADSHLAIGRGTIDFGRVIEAVRRDRPTEIIEVGTFEGVLESMRALEAIGP